MKIGFRCLLLHLIFLFISLSPLSQAALTDPFTAALDALQKRIGYEFQSVDLLRRAVTHPSYSRDNYRSLGILGRDAACAAFSLRFLGRNPDASAAELNRRLADSAAAAACATDGTHLGLAGVIRVAPRTNASAPAVVCGAFRAVIGAVALDSGKADAGGDVFLRVHGRQGGDGGGFRGFSAA